MADTLIRETAPPAGAPASPVPQVWNPATSSYEKVEGSEGAPKMRADDGKIATLGAKADAAVTDPTLSASEIALLKGLLKQLQGTGPVITPVLQYGRKMQVDTIINAVSVSAGGNTGLYSLGLTNESRVYVLINIDQQPWTAWTSSPWGASLFHDGLYPKCQNVTSTCANLDYPKVSLVTMPLSAASWSDASGNRITGTVTIKIRIDNQSSDTATVTVRVLRVFD